MSNDALHVTGAEMEILQLLWHSDAPLMASAISAGIAHRAWKPSTVHTLAIHLVKKGILGYYQVKGKNYYFPIISAFDYQFVTTKDFVARMHGGSLINLVETMLCDCDMAQDELNGLKALVNAAVLPREASETIEQSPENIDDFDGFLEKPAVERNPPSTGCRGSGFKYIKLILNYYTLVEFVHKSGYNSCGMLPALYWRGRFLLNGLSVRRE